MRLSISGMQIIALKLEITESSYQSCGSGFCYHWCFRIRITMHGRGKSPGRNVDPSFKRSKHSATIFTLRMISSFTVSKVTLLYPGRDKFKSMWASQVINTGLVRISIWLFAFHVSYGKMSNHMSQILNVLFHCPKKRNQEQRTFVCLFISQEKMKLNAKCKWYHSAFWQKLERVTYADLCVTWLLRKIHKLDNPVWRFRYTSDHLQSPTASKYPHSDVVRLFEGSADGFGWCKTVSCNIWFSVIGSQMTNQIRSIWRSHKYHQFPRRSRDILTVIAQIVCLFTHV